MTSGPEAGWESRMRIVQSRLGFVVVLAALAAGVFVALTAFMRSLEKRALGNTAIRDQLTAEGRARPLADVARTIAKLQLVTAEVETRVATNVTHENWRGMASANVEAPARLLFGVDVSGVAVRSVGFSPATSADLVRIPPPMRIATEVCSGDETVSVQVGWARLRSRAGEYYLGLARKGLYERARDMTLSPADAQTVRETTRRQVEQAVRAMVGGAASVTVVFDEDAAMNRQAEAP
jgi:hypothetical protein